MTSDFDAGSRLARVLEPEVMDTREEAVDYDAMDHRAVNRLFVDHLLQAARLTGIPLAAANVPADAAPVALLDVGAGTAQIPIELCERNVKVHVTAIDLAAEMLALGRKNVEAAGWSAAIALEQIDAKALPYADGRFDVVMSNSIVHHIPEPVRALREMVRVVRPGGLLFVRDLMRPFDRPTLESIVERYAGNENARQRKMFRDSLHAALTLAEVRELCEGLRVPPLAAVASSDRHWTLAARL